MLQCCFSSSCQTLQGWKHNQFGENLCRFNHFNLHPAQTGFVNLVGIKLFLQILSVQDSSTTAKILSVHKISTKPHFKRYQLSL